MTVLDVPARVDPRTRHARRSLAVSERPKVQIVESWGRGGLSSYLRVGMRCTAAVSCQGTDPSAVVSTARRVQSAQC